VRIKGGTISPSGLKKSLRLPNKIGRLKTKLPVVTLREAVVPT